MALLYQQIYEAMRMNKVYVKTDITGRIVAVNSDAFMPSTDGWTQIDEGETDKFHHAQGNYFSQPIMTEQGVYRYKLANGKVKKRTAKELQADIDLIPPPPPTMQEELTALKAKLAVMEGKAAKFETMETDLAEVKRQVSKQIEPLEPIELPEKKVRL